MRGEPTGPHDWLDSDAGPVVRPYAVTGGRVHPTGAKIDLLAFVPTVSPISSRNTGASSVLPSSRSRSPISPRIWTLPSV
jgi:hypothetical protein